MTNRRRGGTAAAMAVVLALALSACTSPEGGADPSASPTSSETATAGSGGEASPALPTVAVVLPSRNSRPLAEIRAQQDALEAIADGAVGRGVVNGVRAVVPDRFSTVSDVVELLAEEGTDLVCALGPGAARAVREVAPRFPETKFCAAPGRLPNVPENALVFDIRVEETAYLAGIAARFAADTVAGGGRGAPVLIVGDRSQGARLLPGFEAGFLPVREGDDSTPLLVAADAAQGIAAVESQADQRAWFVFAAAGRAELGVAEAAAEAGIRVAGSAAWLQPLAEAALAGAGDTGTEQPVVDPSASPTPPPGPAWNLVMFGEDLTTAVRDALDELAAGWTGGSRSLGFANGALTVVAGTAPAWTRIAPQVLGALEAVVQGDIVVPTV